MKLSPLIVKFNYADRCNLVRTWNAKGAIDWASKGSWCLLKFWIV